MAVDSMTYGLSHETPSMPHMKGSKNVSMTAKTPRTTNIPELPRDIDVIDIRRDGTEMDLKEDIQSMLSPVEGPKQLPTMLLYDEKGLQLFEDITYLEEYYLTNSEIEVLTNYADEMAKHIQPGSMAVELGSGNLRKVSILLNALERAGKAVDYYALDLNLEELRRTLSAAPQFRHVRCHGLLGTYDDGLDWLQLPENAARPKCIMTMGSSIGNFDIQDAGEFLQGFAKCLCNPGDTMLVGLDGCDDPAKVFHAYNDSQGVTHRFIMNGLQHTNKIFGRQVFDLRDWTVVGKYVYDDHGGRHEAYYRASRDVDIGNVHVRAGEEIQVERSLKFSPNAARALWDIAGLQETQKWSASSENYNVHMLKRRPMTFFTQPSEYAATTVPSLNDWKQLWAAWDAVTRGMLPDEELLQKPIKLRNACIFYLGHIPTFLDIQLSKVTSQPLCEPSSYSRIFERGIDPDVEDPEKCHDHSEIPDEWPALDEILLYQDRVRSRVEKLYDGKVFESSRALGRAIWVGFEHEVMHLETLLYMLLQSDKTRPPPGVPRPNFQMEAKLAEAASVPNQWFTIPERTLTVGLDDPDDNSGPNNHFGWDNEKPAREVKVPSFLAKARPITNGEYAQYLSQTKSKQLPASWTEQLESHHAPKSQFLSNGVTSSSVPKEWSNGKFVKTVFGPVPLSLALHWPVSASYDELAECARWMGGRIPTADEARSIYDHVESLKRKTRQTEHQLKELVPAVNGHLVNNGVQESPPDLPAATTTDEEDAQQLFVDLKGANVGFVNWRPVPVTAFGGCLCGQSEMGGLWEWTSTPLAPHEGFEPMSLYPGYTADFFDGKHNIVLGGSWATHPRVAGRKTFVNWYQHNYPFAWIGARVVKDL